MNTAEHPKMHPVSVVSNEAIAKDTWRICLHAPDLARDLQAGQFVNLDVPGDRRHLLRLPFAPARTHTDEGTLDLIYSVVGEGTQRLTVLRAGDSTTCIGPLGNGWKLSEMTGRPLLVAGGAGLAPINFAAEAICNTYQIPCDAVIAAKSASYLPASEIDKLTQLLDGVGGSLIVTTDDGSQGIAGFASVGVEKLLNEHSYTNILCCGPQPMMASIAALAAAHNIDCQVSLERMMGCGFGACNCCSVDLVDGRRVACCTDGPVFHAWEVLM